MTEMESTGDKGPRQENGIDSSTNVRERQNRDGARNIDYSPTDQIVSRHEFDRLKQRVAELEEQLAAATQAIHDGLDSRDAAVLEEIDHGEQVTARHLRRLYQRETDVSQDATLRKRIKNLTGQSCFKKESTGRWVYRGN